MSRTRILIIEDDHKTAESVATYIRHEKMEATVVHTGPAGLEAARSGEFDLVVLDVMLPGMDGMEICRRLRASSAIPIIMLTARTFESDRVRGLDTGADDYMPKPFSPRELMARIRAVLRRGPNPPAGPSVKPLVFADLSINATTHEVTVKGKLITLTPSEFKVLLVMARHPGWVYDRERLIEEALDIHYTGDNRTIDTHIKNIRRKLDPDRCGRVWIETVFGVGYKFTGRPAGE